MLPLTVTTPGSLRRQLGPGGGPSRQTNLAADLSALQQDIDASYAAPSDPALASRVVAQMNTIIGQELTASYFQSIVPNLTQQTNNVSLVSGSSCRTPCRTSVARYVPSGLC